MNCTNCGENLAPGTTSCPKCGTPVVSAQPVAPMPQPVAQPVAPAPMPAAQPVVTQPVAPTPQPMMTQTMPAGMPQPSPVPVQQQPAPQPAVQAGVAVQPASNGSSKKGIIIAVVVLLLAAVLGLGGYLVYDKLQEKKARDEIKEEIEKYEEEQKEEEKIKEELPKQILVKKETKLSDGSLLMLVENKSDRHVTVDLELEFYDSTNKILGTSDEMADIAPKGESYFYFDKYALKEGYASYKTNFAIDDFSNIIEIKQVKQSELTINEVDDEIIIQYPNLQDRTIGSIDVVALYYSNNELVHVESDSEFEIAPGSNANLSLYFYEDNIQYDRYELYTTVSYNRKND